jgi:hypothetical protein
VILIAATNGFSTGFSAKAGSGDHTFDYNAQDGSVAVVGPYETMTFISDGNHNWYIAATN